ncbi:small ribosomal subunit protein uS15m-like [Littorina saxatilis]|uniref:Small ribosomal subunit protein uS15m n=1 Tax=Littorina saxatilis TaxID=31220 RepID=A0AAN9BKG2_9CAEN
MMAGAVKNEVSALSVLLRRLYVHRTGIDHAYTERRNFSSVCLQHRSQIVPLVKTVPGSATPNSHWQNVVCTGSVSGSYLWSRRTYAKAPPSQPKKPLSFDYSGDLMTQAPLSPQDLHTNFRRVPQLDELSESVQKLCTIDFASGSEKKLHRKAEMKERILLLFGSEADREMQVAMLTVDIRNMIPHILGMKKDKLNKSMLVEKIQMRKKILKILRRTDYQRFLWLLQELHIRYVLHPLYYRRVTKKYRRKQEVWEAANSLRLKKIAALKDQLEAEKAEFLRYKEKALKQIEEDAKHYDLDLGTFEEELKRKRIGKTYPRIYTWEERQQMEKDAAMK